MQIEKNTKSPYLSIVTYSRNDNHGENMPKRMQATLTSVIMQLERYKLESEIILVDYNPPPGKPLLKDVLSLPVKTKYCSLRTIIVPSSIHSRYPKSDKLPVYGCLAFNIGLSRSRGKFVMLAPIDNLFSDELIELIGKKNLDGDKFYRADRLDVSRNVLEVDSPPEQLEFCKKNILWIHNRYGSILVVKRKKHLRSTNLDFSKIGNNLPLLHSNAPDIMLMSREKWFLLRGYPEIDIFGHNVDVLLCYMAFYCGLKEEVLPPECCLYHIDHESRWRDVIPRRLEKILFHLFPDRLAIKLRWLINGILYKITPAKLILTPKSKSEIKLNNLGVRALNVRAILIEIKRAKRNIVFNAPEWGLRDEVLDEYSMRLGEWES